MKGEGEVPGEKPEGGEARECHFPLAVIEASAVYGLMYGSLPKGGASNVKAVLDDQMAKMEMPHAMRRRVDFSAELAAHLMQDLREWLIEHLGEEHVILMESAIDNARAGRL